MTPPKPLIDMRTRPIFLHEFFGAVPDTPEFETVRWLNKRVGTKNPDHFSRSRTLASFLSEMDSAGIGRGVVVGRSVPSTRISNDTISETVHRAHGKLIGIASVDPIYLGERDGLAEFDRAITELGLAGLNIDAGFYKTPLRASDDRLMPFYEACDARGIPVCIMSGPTTPDLHFNDPYAVDVVAKTFPQLKIICCHGFYPRVSDIIAVAFRNQNVIISPDMYTWCPGGQLYIDAANGFMQDQFLFGSSYPFREMAQSAQDFLRCGLNPAALAKAGWLTATRLFNLETNKTEMRAGDTTTTALS